MSDLSRLSLLSSSSSFFLFFFFLFFFLPFFLLYSGHISEKACLKMKVFSWVLNSDRVGRLNTDRLYIGTTPFVLTTVEWNEETMATPEDRLNHSGERVGSLKHF